MESKYKELVEALEELCGVYRFRADAVWDDNGDLLVPLKEESILEGKIEQLKKQIWN